MSRASARAHIAIWSAPNDPMTSGATVKPSGSAVCRSGYSICAACSARWILSLRATGARRARRSSQSRSTLISPSGVAKASPSGATSRFSIHARWLGARTTTRVNFAPRMRRTACQAMAPEYAHPACGRIRMFGWPADAVLSREKSSSQAATMPRISRCVPGYHVPANLLSSVIGEPPFLWADIVSRPIPGGKWRVANFRLVGEGENVVSLHRVLQEREAQK